MTTNLKFSITALAALLALSSCSSNRLFDQMDANGNSQITSEEYANHVRHDAFNQINTDNDTFLDSEEWRLAETTEQPTYYGLDTDRDGKVSLIEFKNSVKDHQALKRAFGTADKNKDGWLNKEELNQGTDQ